MGNVEQPIDLSSLCSTKQHDYERNDVRDAFTQLLSMYQPKDGITAYECVLKKAQEFLRNCNLHKKQLLLSTIPSPSNASNHAIRDIFRLTTGFAKLDLSENMDRITDDSIPSSKQEFLYNKNMPNVKLSLCEGFPFRGFPENEISTIRNTVKNVDSSNYQLNNKPKNPLGKGNKCQTVFYRQYLFDKKYCDPIKIDPTESRLSSSSHQADSRSLKTHGNATTTDSCHDKIPRRCNNVKGQLGKSEDINALAEDKETGISQIIIDVRQNATIQQTVKDDTCQINSYSDGDQNIIVDVLKQNAADDLLAIARDRLKASLNNFLERAREGVFVELSAFPRTKPYPRTNALNSVCFAEGRKSSGQKSETSRKVLEKNLTPGVSDSDNYLLSKRQNARVDLEAGQRLSDEQTKRKPFGYVTGWQMRNDSQELSKVIGLQRNNLEPTTTERKQGDAGRFACKAAGSRSNGGGNLEMDSSASSMSELAAYKKKYYDTLLNIQRAKVAVTNSLADHLTACNDPYYTNRTLCQQKHMFGQQRHFTVGPQFSTCPSVPDGLSGTRGNHYSWARPDCKYLLLKQLRLQQAPPLYTRDHDGPIRSYMGPALQPHYPPTLNGISQRRHCVRRGDLENFAGKPKGTGCSGVIEPNEFSATCVDSMKDSA